MLISVYIAQVYRFSRVIISTLSGEYNTLGGIAADGNGTVFITDYLNHKIKRIDSSGVETTLAGHGSPGCTDGYGPNAKFAYPQDVAVDYEGNVGESKLIMKPGWD